MLGPPWFVMVVDIIASEYNWSRELIWLELDFAEVCVYLDAILNRKAAENGKEGGTAKLTDEMTTLWEVIEAVKAEKRNK
jgi:hypothetical protein